MNVFRRERNGILTLFAEDSSDRALLKYLEKALEGSIVHVTTKQEYMGKVNLFIQTQRVPHKTTYSFINGVRCEL